MLVDGEWRTESPSTITDDGAYVRRETTFRDWIRDDPDARFPAEAGRYHLYVSYACPWAHRTLLVRRMKGLEDAVSVDVVDPSRGAAGWAFSPEKAGCTPDTVLGTDFLRDVYRAAVSDVTTHVSVPVLWDRERATIVNNESREILRMLDTAMDPVASRDVDLAPSRKRETIDRVIDDLYRSINNGVYRAAFARSQQAYDAAVEDLFEGLERWDSTLDDQRFLVGDRLTEADLCLFPTLIRFDHVYHTAPTAVPTMRPEIDPRRDRWRRIAEFDNLPAYVRDIYQLDDVASTVHLDHIVEHYASPGSPSGFQPHTVGAVDLGLDEPHDRHTVGGTTPLGPSL